jgi:thiol-disulfide isomerase/thioredoxin
LHNSHVIPEINAKTKLTLIDFWFSHCNPCISQFPELEPIFEKYKTIGFNIIGISVDTKDKIGDWNKAIVTNHLPWDQYLDLDGHQAKSLSIFDFPTNYLLDGTGKIVAKNLEPSQLLPYLKTLSSLSPQ